MTSQSDVYEPVRAVFASELAQAVRTCLADVHQTAERGEEAAPLRSGRLALRIAFLGFAGDRIRGVLSLAATPAALRELLPASVSSGPRAADLNDWIEELSNRMLGRVQNQLVYHNIDINLATPTSVAGSELSVYDAKSGSWQTYKFGELQLWTRLTVEFESGFEWDPEAGDQEAPLAEGDGLVF